MPCRLDRALAALDRHQLSTFTRPRDGHLFARCSCGYWSDEATANGRIAYEQVKDGWMKHVQVERDRA